MKGEKDLEAANEIREVVANALSSMSRTHSEIYNDGQFANWAANVMINLVCKLAQSFNEPKEKVFEMIDEIWDGLENITKNEDAVLN